MRNHSLRPLLGLLVLAVLTPIHAQTWVTTTDDYIADEVERVIQTRDGRFLAVANTGRALALIKRNSDGSLLWQRQLMGTPTGEAGRDLLELPDGRIVAAGDIHVEQHGNDDMAIVVVSADARAVHLQRTFGGAEGDDRALGVTPARDGGFLLVGETWSWGTPGRRMLAVRTDAEGGLVWAKAFESAGGDDVLHGAVELPGGGFLAAGGSGSVLNLDANGALVWSRSYGLTEIREVAPAPDGGFVLAGWRRNGNDDVAEVVEIDALGQILRRASYGQPGASYRFFAAAPLDGGGFLAGGEVNGPGPGDFNGWVVRVGPTGDLVWQRHLADGGGEVHSVAADAGGAVVVGGHRGSFPRMMISRLDASGQVPGCSHPATGAARLASTGTWTPVPLTVIEPSTLVVLDQSKPMDDAPSPGDQAWCLGGPTYPPSEVSPPAASGALLNLADDHTLVWEDGAPSAAEVFHVYRGTLADLRSGRGPSCLFGGLASSGATDADVPAAGAGFFYVVAGENGAGLGTLGRAWDGSERLSEITCP